MTVTKKFTIIIALGIIPLLLTAVTPFAGIVFLVYNALFFGLLVIDYIVTPGSDVFTITRDDWDKLYFKADNLISINIKNSFIKPLSVTLRDEIPDWHFNILDSESKDDELMVLANDSATFEYHLFPTKRGSYVFKNIHVRYKGVLGLCYKHFVNPNEKEYKVYPNLQDLSKYRLIMQKNRLLPRGGKRLRLRGVGAEFESLREYVEGDDFRKINWMCSARESKLIVNQYEAEKNQPVFMLIDTGKPMSYCIQGYKKLDYAINATLILSDIVNQKGDNSGLMVFDTDVQSIIMPAKGEVHRNLLMEELYHLKDTKNVSNYRDAFNELLKKQKRRSLVFIFTDFETSDEAKELLNNVSLIMRHHVPIIVLMKNESLLKIINKPYSKEGAIKASFERGIALEFLREREKIIRSLNARGIACVESDADKFALTAVNKYLDIKNRVMA